MKKLWFYPYTHSQRVRLKKTFKEQGYDETCMFEKQDREPTPQELEASVVEGYRLEPKDIWIQRCLSAVAEDQKEERARRLAEETNGQE